MSWIEEHRQYINTGIDRLFHDRYNSEVTESEKIFQEAILDAIRPDRKTRIHGILSMVVYEEVLWLLAADSIVDILIGVELIQESIDLHVQERTEDKEYISRHGEKMAVLVADVLYSIGIECLGKSGRVNVIQETLHAVGDFWVLRWFARDIHADFGLMEEPEYISMLDNKYSRFIGSAMVTGALVTGDMQQRFLDELRRFGTFLARLYQIRMDLLKYERQQKAPESAEEHRKWVVDFLWYEKATLLRANIEFELVKMTNNFQSPKFKDLVEFFARETI